MFLNFNIPQELFYNLSKVAEIRKMEIGDIVKHALEQEVSPYENKNSQVLILPAKVIISIDGKETPDCFFLEDITVMGQPYAKIYLPEEDHLVKVPKNLVKIN